MDPHSLERLRRAFAQYAESVRSESPVLATLAHGLGADPGPDPALADIFGRYFRIISDMRPDAPLLLAALHHQALTGGAPRLAAFLPSCGGAYNEQDRPALIRAAKEDLLASREDILDFLLSHSPQVNEVQRSAAVMLGALATVATYGGGLSLVELGTAGGLNLRFDQYAYRYGDQRLGSAPLELAMTLSGGVADLLRQGGPAIVGRRGLDIEPKDLTSEPDRQLMASFLPPDDLPAHQRFRTACELLAQAPQLDLRQGSVEIELPALLLEAYREMEPGNTLFLYHTLVWPYLTEEERQQLAYGVQKLASRIEPRKPIAWLQMEPFTPGAQALELRLHTFGWVDPEDRAVRKLAELNPSATRMNWLA